MYCENGGRRLEMTVEIRKAQRQSISIPDDFADVLGSSAEERGQCAREAIALELYREGKLSLRRMGELAGVGDDYWAAESFRARHNAPLNYSIEDLEADRATALKLLKP
jgi:predicted HTH domain antitoxin